MRYFKNINVEMKLELFHFFLNGEGFLVEIFYFFEACYSFNMITLSKWSIFRPRTGKFLLPSCQLKISIKKGTSHEKNALNGVEILGLHPLTILRLSKRKIILRNSFMIVFLKQAWFNSSGLTVGQTSDKKPHLGTKRSHSASG